MPDEVRKKAPAELRKLETGGSQSHESPFIRNYLDLPLDLPWVTEEKKSIDIVQARSVLESNHNGLDKVKERIIQHLAVMKLKKEKQGSILLLTVHPIQVKPVSERVLYKHFYGNASISASGV